MYEWDDNKNNINEEKHGLRFEVAVEVFSDPYAIVQFNRDTNGEKRDQIIGKLQGEVIIVFVVFTKCGQKLRIISARKANKKERTLYEKQESTN